MSRRSDTALVLVVDDNQMERFLARESLEMAGFDVIEACDGKAGLEMLAERDPDVVLLDVKMPVMDGFEACAALRAREDGRHVPVLMLTGLDDIESINRAYDVGATDFYSKPVNVAILVHRVRYLLRAKRLADDLRDSRAQLAHAQRLAKLGYWKWDLEAQGFEWSTEITSILGRTPATSGGRAVLVDLVPEEDRALFEAALERALGSGGVASVEHRVVREDGSERVVHEEIEATLGADGEVERLVGTLQDITERRQSEARIRHLAYHDTVTGLPNRVLLREHLGRALAYARRHRRAVAVMFLDLDRFKRVNDTLGHDAGDELLCQVAERLVDSLRECDHVARPTPPAPAQNDGDGCTVARIGGDEFVVLLTEVRELADAAAIARRVRDAMAPPFELAGNEVYVSTSIGISGYPDDGADADTLLKQADAAMYHAKAEGRDRFQFFTAAMNERSVDRFELETALRKAIEEGELVLHYQPIVDARRRTVRGVEALVRWQHPTRGMVSPGEFIPLAEETGLILPLGQWVTREACRQLAAWRRAGLADLYVSINVSAAQFTDRGFIGQVEAAIADAGLDPRRVELELTESMLMSDSMRSAELITRLKDLGVRIAIDDFGTGYSSLAYLKRFPIDSLKIDRSFIREIASDPDDAAIVNATIGLGRSLRLKVIAEGVEEQAQLERLVQGDCDACQGYLFAPPMPADDLVEWVGRGVPGATPDGEEPVVALPVNRAVG